MKARSQIKTLPSAGFVYAEISISSLTYELDELETVVLKKNVSLFAILYY